MILFTPNKFTMIKFFSVLTGFDSIFKFVKKPKPNTLIPVRANIGKEFTGLLTKANALLTACVIFAAFCIYIVLRARSHSQITAPIVPAITVNMVCILIFFKFAWVYDALHDNAVHPYIGFLSGGLIFKSYCIYSIYCNKNKPILQSQIRIAIIYYGDVLTSILAVFTKGNFNSHFATSFAESRGLVRGRLDFALFGFDGLSHALIIAQEQGIA